MVQKHRRLIPLLLLALLILHSVTAVTLGQAPRLAVLWLPDHLQITWAANQPACLYLTGGGRLDTRIPTPQCSAGGQIALAYAGVSADYTPLGRSFLELRAGGQTLARLALVPPSRILLPLIVTSPPAPRLQMYLPAITRAPEAAGAALEPPGWPGGSSSASAPPVP